MKQVDEVSEILSSPYKIQLIIEKEEKEKREIKSKEERIKKRLAQRNRKTQNGRPPTHAREIRCPGCD
jgi:hypothetical protein